MPRRLMQPELFSFDAVMSACEKGVQWETALGLLQEVPRRALQLDLFSCDAALSSYEKSVK